MSEIVQNYQKIRSTLPQGVTLVAVSKFHPVEAIAELYNVGHRAFGESRAQELGAKHSVLPPDVEWHFIGHLQTNKVKNVVPYVSLIHGVDSAHLLREIDKESAKIGRVTDCLLQAFVAQEETKFGFSEDELFGFLQSGEWRNFQHVRICGLMGMASNVDDEAQIRVEFRQLKNMFDKAKTEYFPEEKDFCHLSMGMSHDYKIAMEEGSTMVRIGTSIFGEREY